MHTPGTPRQDSDIPTPAAAPSRGERAAGVGVAVALLAAVVAGPLLIVVAGVSLMAR